MSMSGQSTFESAGQSKGFMVNPLLETKMFHDSRKKSIVGKLASMVGDEDLGNGQMAGQVLPGSAILTKIIEKGDEYRFQMSQNLDGDAVFGDKLPNAGDYMAFLNSQVFLNQIKCPAFPEVESMSKQRMKGVIDDWEGPIKDNIEWWFAEQHTMDFYDALLRGASRTLMAPRAEGGRAMDLGLGAGVQVSPQHFVCAGTGGFVDGVSGTAPFETNVATELSELTNDEANQISHGFLYDLDNALESRNQLPLVGSAASDGKEEWVCPVDPDVLAGLAKPGGDLGKRWEQAMERGASNPVFGPGEIKIGRLRLIPDQWIKKFRPSVSDAGVITWGNNNPSNNKRKFTSDSNIGLMFVIGRTAMLEAVNGAITHTYDAGKHGVGATVSAYVKQAFKRTRWEAEDGRALSSDTLRERGLVVCAFNIPQATL